MPGMGVRTELATAGRLCTAGIVSLVNAHPVIAPSEFPEILSRVSGVEVNLSMTAALRPGVYAGVQYSDDPR